MAATPPNTKGKPKGKGFRIAGYNGWLILGGLGAAIVVGLYLRSKLSGTASTTAATQPVDTSSPAAGSSGGASSSPDTSSPNATGNEDLANSIYTLAGILGAGAAPGGTYVPPPAPYSGTTPLNLIPSTPSTPTAAAVPSASGAVSIGQGLIGGALGDQGGGNAGTGGALDIGSNLISGFSTGGTAAGTGGVVSIGQGVISGASHTIPTPPQTTASVVGPPPSSKTVKKLPTLKF